MTETIETTVSTTPQPEATVTTPAADKGPSAEDLAAIQASIDALKAENNDLRRSNEFWADQARSAARTPPAPPAAKPEPEPEDDTDLLDLISTGGAKAFAQYMKKKGFVTKEEAAEMANNIASTKANQLTTEAELLRNYPELGDKSSPFFKATAANYGDLVKEGVPPQLAMRLAAERAELQGIKTGKVKTPQQKNTEQDREAQRQRRIDAQSGDRGQRVPIEAEEDESDELTAEQKYICKAMNISEEAYKKRAMNVSLGGIPQRAVSRKKA
jgi:hypothetical protein